MALKLAKKSPKTGEQGLGTQERSIPPDGHVDLSPRKGSAKTSLAGYD